jgi:hypothetical protein
MMKKKNLIISGIAVALLSGCGHSKDNNGGGTPFPVPADSFLSEMRGSVGNLLDDTEPTDIDGVAVTLPEETEPEDI